MYVFSKEDSLMWTVLAWVNIKSFTLLGTLPDIFEKRLLLSSPLYGCYVSRNEHVCNIQTQAIIGTYDNSIQTAIGKINRGKV